MTLGTVLRPAATLLIAACGGYLFLLMHVPLAWMLGALVATVSVGRLWSGAHVPLLVRNLFVPILGVLLGSSFTPALIHQIPEWPAGILFVIGFAIVITALGTLYFRRVAGFDARTSFFCGLPGGLSDMSMIGSSLGANIGVLATVHSVRILLVVLTIPFAVRLIAGVPLTTVPLGVGHGTLLPTDIAVLVACGLGGWRAGVYLKIPAAPILGPLFISAAVHLLQLTEGRPPAYLVAAAQVVLGGYIGARFSTMSNKQLGSIAVHGAVWAFLMMVCAAIGALIASEVTDFDFTPMLLALAPGGFAEMALMTLSLGIDVAFVSTCHLVRLLAVYSIVPSVVAFNKWRPPET